MITVITTKTPEGKFRIVVSRDEEILDIFELDSLSPEAFSLIAESMIRHIEEVNLQ